jgi:hypothetical protein
MTLAKAKAKTNETFIVQASLTIVTYNHKNMFIAQATVLHCGLYYKYFTIINDNSSVVRMMLQFVASPTISILKVPEAPKIIILITRGAIYAPREHLWCRHHLQSS